jgi:hypothetical protein
MSTAATPFKPVKALSENCLHFKVWEKQGDARMTVGDCRLNEPGNFQIGENKFLTKWPSVKNTDFCGKFAPKLNHLTNLGKTV